MSSFDKPRVILAGGSGFMGMAIAADLARNNYQPIVLTRGPDRSTPIAQYVHWDAKTTGPWVRHLDRAYAIVNLVGRSVDCRKTSTNRVEILSSRIDSVTALAQAFNQVANPPRIWIQSATAHIYGDTADEILDESSPIGAGFAPIVGSAWEKAMADAHLPNCRRIVLRISFVLGRDGGALRTLARLTRLFLGGRVGSGRQYISWIHMDDICAIVRRALTDPMMEGIYVTTAPNPVTNDEFMRQLRLATHRPWSPPTPAFIVRLASIFLRTDPELALLGRRCVPTRLLKEGYSFHHPTLSEALTDLLSPTS